MKFKWYCTCGASHTGTVPDSKLTALQETHDRIHSGPGHSPCSSRSAARARAKSDAEKIAKE